jgi:hypothetical protein
VDRALDSIPLPVPDEVKAAILALVLLAIVLGAHSLLVAGRARRLGRQRATLLEDVGLLQQALLPRRCAPRAPLRARRPRHRGEVRVRLIRHAGSVPGERSPGNGRLHTVK